jgi:hypothetical protein
LISKRKKSYLFSGFTKVFFKAYAILINMDTKEFSDNRDSRTWKCNRRMLSPSSHTKIDLTGLQFSVDLLVDSLFRSVGKVLLSKGHVAKSGGLWEGRM